jgi:hypothetical protein
MWNIQGLTEEESFVETWNDSGKSINLSNTNLQLMIAK